MVQLPVTCRFCTSISPTAGNAASVAMPSGRHHRRRSGRQNSDHARRQKHGLERTRQQLQADAGAQQQRIARAAVLAQSRQGAEDQASRRGRIPRRPSSVFIQ